MSQPYQGNFTGQLMEQGSLPKPRWQSRLDKWKARQYTSPHRAPPRRLMQSEYVGLCLPIAFPDRPLPLDPRESEAFCNAPCCSGFGN